MESKIRLGSIIRDRITHVEGCVTAVTTYLYSAASYRIAHKQPDGSMIETWHDAERVIYVGDSRDSNVN